MFFEELAKREERQTPQELAYIVDGTSKLNVVCKSLLEELDISYQSKVRVRSRKCGGEYRKEEETVHVWRHGR